MALPTSFKATGRLMSINSPCWRSTSRNWRKSWKGIFLFLQLATRQNLFPGRSAARSAAKWCAADPGSLQAPSPERSRISSAPLRAALHPGNATFSHHVAHHHFALARRSFVELRIHPTRQPFALERRLKLLADRRIFLVIGNGAAAFAEIDGAVIHQLLAGHARLAGALVVRAVPGGDAQALFADAEMLVVPVAAHRRGRDQTDRLVILAQNFIRLAVLPRRGAEHFRPRIGVALAFDADEHGGGGVLVRLGIAAGLVLADPQIETVLGHRRLDPPIAGRAA